MAEQKHRASRLASGDWEYRGFIISQDYRTKRWVAFLDGPHTGEPIFWAQTLRSSKVRVDDHLSSHKETDDA